MRAFVSTFSETCQRYADRPALTFRAESYSYRELQIWIDQVKRRLKVENLQHEEIVGVMMERRPIAIVTVLALVSLGICFCPLDFNEPEERLKSKLGRSPFPLIRQERPQSDDLYSVRPVQRTGQYSRPNDRAKRPFYLLFTSGSEGRPKGALIGEEGFLNLLNWYQEAFGIHPRSQLLLTLPLFVDASWKNIFGALAAGACLHLPANQAYNALEVLQLIDTKGVTHLNCLPRTIYPVIKLAQRFGRRKLRHLKELILGSEEMDVEQLAPYADQGGCIHNVYGPTECTDIVTHCQVTSSMLRTSKQRIPLGTPIPGAAVLLLNEQGHEVGPEEVGELYVGGVGVGLGYRNELELTREKFIYLQEFGGQRYYRTGDLACWRNGHLELIGRCDRETHIRGHRVNLAEIEWELRRIDGVEEAHVFVSDSTLAAVIKNSLPLSEEKLKMSLSKRLPHYFVPTRFQYVDKTPILPGGKVDKSALQEL